MAKLNNPDQPPNDGKIRLPSVDNAMNRVAPNRLSGGKGSRNDNRFVALGAQPDARQKVLARALKRFDRIATEDSDNRTQALDDLRFYNGDQWPANIRAQRVVDRRPCLTVNKLPVFVHQVTNDLRQNRPSIMVSPVGDKGDKDVALMYRGMIRAIERDSVADIAYDTAVESAARIGFGYWRILTEFEQPDSFNQIILIKRIRNPFTVYLDPDHQEPDGSDAKYGFITELVPRSEFEDDYPKADPMSWGPRGIGDDQKNWVYQETVRVSEYFEVSEEQRWLVALSNGHIGWEDELSDATKALIQAEEIDVERRERKRERKVTRYKISAVEVLEEQPWVGQWIPIVKVIGDEVDVEGKVTTSGIVRHAKDPQRQVNFWETSYTELVALQPKAPYIMEEGQVEGHETQWKQSNIKNFAYLLYRGVNLGGKPAPPPTRQPFGGVPAGIQQAIANSAQNMMATTGIRFDATKAERMVDESGVAIKELRRSGDLGSFHYMDNLSRALRHTGRILVDLIPKVYDTKRVVTILREDDTEEQVVMDPNAPQPYREQRGAEQPPGGMGPASAPQQDGGAAQKVRKIFNPTYGRYGVTVTIGPSYATKRIEASDSMLQFAKAVPGVGALIADLIAKNQDWPGSEEMAKRLAKAVPAQLMTPDQKDITPQVQAMLGNLEAQIKQLTDERMQMLEALNSQQADRAQRQDEINKAFEAKMAAVEAKFAEALIKAGQTSESEGGKQQNEAVRLMIEHLARANEAIELSNERAFKAAEEASGIQAQLDALKEAHAAALDTLAKRDSDLAERLQQSHKTHAESLGELKAAIQKPRKIKVTRRDAEGRAADIEAE